MCVTITIPEFSGIFFFPKNVDPTFSLKYRMDKIENQKLTDDTGHRLATLAGFTACVLEQLRIRLRFYQKSTHGSLGT